MARIDIRNESQEEVNEIVFADFNSSNYACIITNSGSNTFIEGEDSSVVIPSKEHAQNLIKSLNKAIELGWFE